jgi:hypothetical protein
MALVLKRTIEKKNSNDLIGIGTRDLLACSLAPQSTTLPCASRKHAINEQGKETEYQNLLLKGNMPNEAVLSLCL